VLTALRSSFLTASDVHIESLCVGQNEETQTELEAFSNWMEKAKVRLGDKVTKLWEERELLRKLGDFLSPKPADQA